MKIRFIYNILIITTLLFFSCKEDIKGPLFESSETPNAVSNIRVENQPGGAKITYTLPDDPNIAYVEASYTGAGERRTNISSLYQNTISIEGLYDNSEQIVELTTVNKFNNRSQSVEVPIKPLTAPIVEFFNSIDYGPTFGGLYYRFENTFQHEYVVHTMIKDSLDEWLNYDRFYSLASSEIVNSVRDLDPKPILAGIYVEDIWSNKSDTVIFEFTPLYEERFDKNLWAQFNLPDDTNAPQYGPLEELWSDKDGILTDRSYFFQSPNIPGLTLPNWFTIDLGADYKFGRMLVNNVHHGDRDYHYWRYAMGTPQTFEIWGTNNPSIDWNNWTLLGSFECVKPSGAPIGVIEDIDYEQIIKGDEYDFPPQGEDDYYRYIRFKTNTTFGGNANVYLLELTFWGQKRQD